MPDNDAGSALIALCDELIHTRQHIGPKHLAEPGPDDATLREILRAAAAAPDHERLRPWRLIVIGRLRVTGWPRLLRMHSSSVIHKPCRSRSRMPVTRPPAGPC